MGPGRWSGAQPGEANLPWYLAKGFPYDDRQQVHGWTEVMRFIRATDPFHRPLTIHPTGIGRLSARHATDDTSLLDFDMLQTPHGQREAVLPTVQTMRESYPDQPVMPVINGEASYEMLFRPNSRTMAAGDVLVMPGQWCSGPHLWRQWHLAAKSAWAAARRFPKRDRHRLWDHQLG